MSSATQSVGAVLVICNGQFEGTRHPVQRDETLIGRNPRTDITLLDESISREHAIVAWDDTRCLYTLEDLQSTNGSKVNGKRIRASDLAHGDVLEIGHTKFKFLLRESSGSAEE